MSAKENCGVPRRTGERKERGWFHAFPFRARWSGLLCAALLAAAGPGTLRTWALRICAHCGHEALEDATACGHCGADFSPVAPDAPAEEPPEPLPPSPGIRSAVRMAAEHEQRAQDWADQEQWVGAILFLRNARALLALAGADNAGVMADLARRSTLARIRAETMPVECPLCEGTGHLRTRMVTLQGETIEREVIGSACALCRGLRSLSGRRSAAEMHRLYVEGERHFAAEQQRLGSEQRFGIWLPRGLLEEEPIPVSRLAAMLRAYDVLCESCRGMGHSGCRRCRGTGVVVCGNRACLHGVETCPGCQGRGRTQGRRCADCNGTGRRECAECEGHGFLSCSDCEGRGNRLCTACRGAGRPAACTRCDGEGTAPCGRCRGTGERRGVACSHCRGEGVVLCSACRGAGRRQR